MCAVASVYCIEMLLGVRSDTITNISSDGVEFSQEAKGEIASLAKQVNALSKTVDASPPHFTG